MKPLNQILLILCFFITINSRAQESDLKELLKVHDILYYNRVGANGDGSHSDYKKCEALFKKSYYQIYRLQSNDSLRIKYPYTFASTLSEYYALKISTLFFTQPVKKIRKLWNRWIASPLCC